MLLLTAYNSDGSLAIASNPTAKVPAAPENGVAPTASGTAQRTYTLSATTGTWALGNTYTYQWQRSIDGTIWADILAATSLTYTLTQADEGNYVRFQVTAVNPDSMLGELSSTTAKVAGAPPVNSVAPALTARRPAAPRSRPAPARGRASATPTSRRAPPTTAPPGQASSARAAPPTRRA